MQYRNDDAPNRGRKFGRERGAGRGFTCGCGKSDGTSCGTGHQMSFCKMEINRESDDGIGSTFQNKVDSSLNLDSKDKEGVCYFLKSRLPTAQGTVNGKKVIALRDTGCTGCVIRRSLISDDQLIGKKSDVTLIDETTQRLPSIETERVAEALIAMFSRVGIPSELLIEHESRVTIEVMNEVSRLLSLQQLTTIPYRPYSKGPVEKFHAMLKRVLLTMCAERPNDWDKYLPALLFAVREIPQGSLVFSTFELLY